MRDIATGIIILFLILALIILFCVIFIRIYVTKIKKYNQQLFEKEIEKQKSVNTAITETQDQTLNQISQELHDDIGQQLTVINMQLEQLKVKNTSSTKTLNPISANLRSLSTSIRELSHGLTSNSFQKESLFSAIRRELKRCERLGIHCSLNVQDEELFSFSNEHKVILYRIFQEVLNNVLKHSEAKSLIVTVQNPSKPIFQFKDDGVGIKDTQVAMHSNGMQNMKSRAQIIDYEMTVESSNEGTIITLKSTSE